MWDFASERKSRLKSARNVSANEIANVLRMWMAAKGTENIGELLFLEHWWNNTRKMPRAAQLLEFNDIAQMFVRLAPPRKLKFVSCYDALLQAQPPFELDKHQKARSQANNLLTILGWFRSVALYPGKREIVFRHASPREKHALAVVLDKVQVDRDDYYPYHQRFESTPPSLHRSRSSLSTSSSRTMPLMRSLSNLSTMLADNIRRSCSDAALPGSENRIVLAHKVQANYAGETNSSSLEDLFDAFEDLAPHSGATLVPAMNMAHTRGAMWAPARNTAHTSGAMLKSKG